MESRLLSLGLWPIRITQLIGYFPLSIQKTSKSIQESSLKFKLRSIPVLLSLVTTTISILWLWTYFYNLRHYLRFIKIYGPTERYAHTLFVMVTSIAGVYFRVAALYERHATLKFWKRSCITFNKVETALGHFKSDLLQEKEFQSIKKSLKICVFLSLLSSVVHTILVHIYRGLRSLNISANGTNISGKIWTKGSELQFGSALWAFFTLLHISNTIWISFFIQLYTACFKAIAKRIRRSGDPWSCWKSTGEPVDNNGKFLRMDQSLISELILVKSKPRAIESGKSGTKLLESELSRCIQAFTILEKEVEIFNDFFGGKLVVEVLICVINLVVHLFFMSLWLGRGVLSEIVPIVSYFLVNAYELYSLGTKAGQMTLATGEVAEALFENRRNGDFSCDMQFKLEMLCSKIGSNPPVISARDFFVVNRHLVTSVLSALTTFLVVLVQFRDADYTDSLRFRTDGNNSTLRI